MLIDVKTISDQIRTEMAQEVAGYKAQGYRTPCLVVVKVGNDTASEIYVRNKENACKEVGILTRTVCLPENAKKYELANVLLACNEDENVDGILLQLPLPEGLPEGYINLINPDKDVDGITDANLKNLYLGRECIKPCTPAGVLELIDRLGIELEGKDVLVIGRSREVGAPMAKMLLDRNASVKVCHSKTTNLDFDVWQSQVIVSAVGRKGMIANVDELSVQWLFDVGISREGKKIYGDVSRGIYDLPNTYITPVPKGIGLMTVTMLLKNTLELFRQHIGISESYSYL